MRCKYCNIEVNGNAIVCPLCHEKLEGEPNGVFAEYPPKKSEPVNKHSHFTFKHIYIFVAVTLFLVSVAINLIYSPTVQWFWLIAILGVYLYILVYNTILSSNSIGAKIFLQGLCIFLIIYATYGVLNDIAGTTTSANWLLDYALSTVILLSLISIIIYTLIMVRNNYSLLIDINFISLMGFVPIILYACKLIINPTLAIACAILSSLVIVGSILFGRKELASEFKKKFHI